MFVGDAEENELNDVAWRYGDELDADVYKVGHHGSFNSSSEEFLKYVTPKYSVISCADRNDYVYPHAEALAATQVPEAGTYKYVKNTSSHRFHLPGCDSVKDMKEKNKEYSDQSRDEIIAEGYKPCQRCMP